MFLRINSLLAAPPPCQNHASDTYRHCRPYIVRRGGACEIRCIVLVAGCSERGCILLLSPHIRTHHPISC
jgi:hypothetical protein